VSGVEVIGAVKQSQISDSITNELVGLTIGPSITSGVKIGYRSRRCCQIHSEVREKTIKRWQVATYRYPCLHLRTSGVRDGLKICGTSRGTGD